ncbi:MAG: hypothetical protein IJT50_00940, partial [Lentisphaeria bacterium]|nr:hypothetical protein [Lentisphaeria bacterium]
KTRSKDWIPRFCTRREPSALHIFLRRAVQGEANLFRVFLPPRPHLFQGAFRLQGEMAADLFGA